MKHLCRCAQPDSCLSLSIITPSPVGPLGTSASYFPTFSSPWSVSRYSFHPSTITSSSRPWSPLVGPWKAQLLPSCGMFLSHSNPFHQHTHAGFPQNTPGSKDTCSAQWAYSSVKYHILGMGLYVNGLCPAVICALLKGQGRALKLTRLFGGKQPKCLLGIVEAH